MEGSFKKNPLLVLHDPCPLTSVRLQ